MVNLTLIDPGIPSLLSPPSYAELGYDNTGPGFNFNYNRIPWSEPYYLNAGGYHPNSHEQMGHKTRGHHSQSSPSDPNVSWYGIFHLLVLSLVSTAGTMGSIFVISAITVIDTFQVRGNAYLVSLAMGHLLVTIFVLPASCVAILAGIPKDPSICHFQWITTIGCLIISVLSFMFMAMENFTGLGSIVTYDLCCTKFRIVFLILIIWAIGIGLPLGQHFHNFGPSFCEHEKNLQIHLPYHASMSGILILFPTLVTIWYFSRSIFKVKSLKVQIESGLDNPAAYYLTDEPLLQSNVFVYVFSFLMWVPLCVVASIGISKPVTQDILNTTWWIAIGNSCSYSFVYAMTNKDFAEAFFKLFYYCCCKSHVTFTRKGGGPRRGLANDPMGLRVHIIPGLNIYAQRKDTTVPAHGGNYSMTSTHVHHSGGFGGGGTRPFGGMGGGPFARSFHTKIAGSAKESSQL